MSPLPKAPAQAQDASSAEGSGVGGVTVQDAPTPAQRPRKGHALRAAKAEARRLAAQAKLDRDSRARLLAEISAEVSGERGAPVPLAVACRAHGISPRTVEAWLERGEAPGLDAARARGIMVATRAATGEGPDARQWAWLAERLAPKELHLPHRVLQGQDPDAAPVEHRVAIDITDARALARGTVARVLPAPVLEAELDPPPGRS